MEDVTASYKWFGKRKYVGLLTQVQFLAEGNFVSKPPPPPYFRPNWGRKFGGDRPLSPPHPPLISRSGSGTATISVDGDRKFP